MVDDGSDLGCMCNLDVIRAKESGDVSIMLLPILSVLMQVRSPSKYGFGSPVTLLPTLISFHSSWLTF